MQLINKRIVLFFCILLFVASISFLKFVICSEFLSLYSLLYLILYS